MAGVHVLRGYVELIAPRPQRRGIGPVALREVKQLLHATRDERSDAQELAAFVRCLESDEGKEGIAAFLEKRRPSWAVGP